MRFVIPFRSTRHGFVMIEAVAVIAIIALLACFVAILVHSTRKDSRQAGSISNLQWLGSGYSSYAQDNAGRVCTFTWRAGESHPGFPIAADDLSAGAYQAVDILRRRSGMNDIPVITAWFPHLFYSQLVLADYLDLQLPSNRMVSPDDANRLAWQRDPAHFLDLPNRPASSGPGSVRWAFSSSYELGPCFVGPDQSVGNMLTIAQSTSHNTFIIGGSTTPLARRLLSETRFPSHKAMMYEQFTRSFGPRQAFYAYPEAKPPVLFVDGSVLVKSMADANQGFQPNSPTTPAPTTFAYQPDLAWEPAPLNGSPTGENVIGRIRWTRRGMLGTDFGLPQVP